MTARQPTLMASVPPPSSHAASSPLRGLPAERLDAPAAEVLAALASPPPPADPETATASDFFAAFGPP